MWGVLASAGGCWWLAVGQLGCVAKAAWRLWVPGETARDGGQSEELEQSAVGGLVVRTTSPAHWL